MSDEPFHGSAPMAISRIRVLVAGDIGVNRALVRPFLEDDGYDVVAETFVRDDVLPCVTRIQPDVVVIDDRLLGQRNGKLLQKVRRAAPDAKVVLFTPGGVRTPIPAETDAQLERGGGLAALSVLLGRLFAQGGPSRSPAVVGAAVASAPRSRTDANGGATRFVAAVGVPLLTVWALIAMITTGGGPALPPADTTDLAGQVAIVPQGIDPLDDAHDSLDRMIAALEAGNYLQASIRAQALMDQRRTAMAGGYLTLGLDGDVRTALVALAGSLPAGVTATLQRILGRLFPVVESEPTPGGGSNVILGPITGGTGRDPATSGGGGGDATLHDGGAGDGGTGGTVIALAPGDGRDWGQSHRETWDRGPPPWAIGHALEARGHRGHPPGHEGGDPGHAGGGGPDA